MKGNPTGCMGVADYLGWDWKSKAGLPIVNVPGCPVQPDNFMETLLYLLRQLAGLAPMIPLDDALRPKWLFGMTVHQGCDRAAYYEQADFTHEYGSRKCLVKIGCWGPVVKPNVPKRGWIAGVGGCPNVGGICIGCTMPGFPDKFMPFMDEPPGARYVHLRLFNLLALLVKQLSRLPAGRWRFRPQRALGAGEDGCLMPELPEVEALAQFVAEKAVGTTVERAEIGSLSALKTYQPPIRGPRRPGGRGGGATRQVPVHLGR